MIERRMVILCSFCLLGCFQKLLLEPLETLVPAVVLRNQIPWGFSA